MASLLNLQKQLQDTSEAIARTTNEIAGHPNHPSLTVNLRSLEKRYRALEERFLSIASQNFLDVCAYRLFRDDERQTLRGFALPLAEFQNLVSLVYEAIKTGPKERARVSPESLDETTFGFGYTYAGSLGVVLTLPNERVLIGQSTFDDAMQSIFDMAGTTTPAEISAFAKRLGPAPIRSMYRWASHHEQSALGADIEWRRGDKVRSKLFIQAPEMSALRNAIEQTSDEEHEDVEFEGLLVGGDVTSGRFHLLLDDDSDLRGTMAEGLEPLELRKRYRVKAHKTSRVKYSIDETEISYHLLSVDLLD